jgi:NAD(P)-dependent dehydrogenase (short-subunit alcohol dehydrogenase family)
MPNSPQTDGATNVARPPVIITGAGSGLGRATALALARRGTPLLLVGRDTSRLIATQLASIETGLTARACHILASDITAPGEANKIVARAIDAFGSIGGLVNNAAVAKFGALDATDEDDWSTTFETNFFAAARLMRAAIPALRESRGMIVNIGSIGGPLAMPERSMYGASKAALMHLTKSMARELAPHIRVNAIIPGAIETEIYGTLGMDEQTLRAFKHSLVSTTPMGRMGTTEDISPWIELLFSDGGRWVTGSLIVIDGGRAC